MVILAINPGGGSTKVAVFRNSHQAFAETIEHAPVLLARYKMVLDQYRLRQKAVLDTLRQHNFDPGKIDAIVSRGGPLMPLPGGVYRITPRVVSDIRRGRVQTLHPSLLGPLVSYELAEELGVPAYFVDPESADEFWDIARVAGLKGVTRRALSHALSCRTVAQAAARKIRKQYGKCNIVVAHLGTGITVAAHVRGRQVDATNANDEGPFSPQRTGSLPTSALVRICYSGRYTQQDVLDLLQRKGGLLSYLGTDDIREVEKLLARGNSRARLVYDSMVYQVAKEIGAYAVTCRGRVDAIAVTGGLARSKRLVGDLRRWVRPLSSRFLVFPGEEEMPALAQRLLAVLNRREKERSYEQSVALGR